jgi:hypothetical protein
MRGWISGRATPPKQAWRNQDYMQKIIGIGTKIDPTWSDQNAAIRLKTQQGYANGKEAQNMTSIATLDEHAADYLKDLREFKKLNPLLIQQILGQGAYANIPLIGASPRLQALIGRLKANQIVVGDEAVRANVGTGAGGVTDRAETKSMLDWRSGLTSGNIDGVISAVETLQKRAHDKMRQLLRRYEAVVGKDKNALWSLYNGYANGRLDENPDEAERATRAKQRVHDMLYGPATNPALPPGVIFKRID